MEELIFNVADASFFFNDLEECDQVCVEVVVVVVVASGQRWPRSDPTNVSGRDRTCIRTDPVVMCCREMSVCSVYLKISG